MTNYRLMDGQAGRPGTGPGTATAFSGNYLAGIGFGVTQPGLWFTGYWWFVCGSGQQVTPVKFALWQITAAASNGILIPGSVVTSGTLTAGQWNFTPVTTPLPLSPNAGTAGGLGPWYQAAVGYVSTTGFPETDNQFGAAQPFAGGIINGPLFAYGNSPGPGAAPAQSQFSSTAGADPSVNMPLSAFNNANFWMDAQVTDQPPPGASYRLFPNQPLPPNLVADTANNFTLGCEFRLNQSCTLNRIWFYSPAGVTQLPTESAIFSVGSQTIIAATDNASPAWSGVAGSGWVSVSYAGVTLQPGDYKVTVFNGAGVPVIWNDSTASYWATGGPGASGLTLGPLSAPSDAAASAPGQDSYHQGTPISWPDTHAGPFNYWVDVEVTPLPVVSTGGGAVSDRGHVMKKTWLIGV